MFHRTIRASVALLLTGLGCVALLFGPAAGEAFAFVAPPVPTMPGVAELAPLTTSAAVDTGVAVAGADATVAGAATATGVCAAVTLGTCAVAAVAVVGAAYGAYKLLHFGWGPHHTVPAVPAGTHYGNATASFTISGGGNTTVSGTLTVTKGSWTGVSCADSTGGTCGNAAKPANTLITDSDTTCDSRVGFFHGGETTYSQRWGSDACQANYYAYFQTGDFGVLKGSANTGPAGLAETAAGSITDNYGTFYFQGSPPTGVTHQITITQQCLTSAGTVASTLTYSGPSFNDTASAPPDITLQACPAATVPGQATVADSENGTATPLYTVPEPQVSPSSPCAPVGAACAPTLQKSTSTGLWVDAPGTQPSVTLDGTYRCEWLGPASASPRPDGGALPMTDCVAAEGTADTSTGTDTGVREGPAVDNNGTNCFLSGWGWNPVDWVYIPVKCALEWAFIPTDAQLQGDFGGLVNAWGSSPPGVVVSGIGTLFAPFVSMPADAGSCDGPDVNVNLPGWNPAGGDTGTTAAPNVTGGTSRDLDMHPFSMCNPVGAWVHSWVMPFVTALLYMAAFVIVARIFTRTIGYDAPFSSDTGAQVA